MSGLTRGDLVLDHAAQCRWLRLLVAQNGDAVGVDQFRNLADARDVDMRSLKDKVMLGCRRLAKGYRRSRLLGWDFCLSDAVLPRLGSLCQQTNYGGCADFMSSRRLVEQV